MSVETALSWMSAGLALFAAIFWFAAARVKLPPMGAGKDALIPADHPLLANIRRAAMRNRWAAFFAGLSAICDVAAVIIHRLPS